MYKLLIIVLLLFSINGLSQEAIEATNEILVTGEVTSAKTFTLADIKKLPVADIPDLIVKNHKGEPRDTVKQLKGVLVKNLLKEVQLKQVHQKLLSAFYFTFIASDHYKVVYSWNEIYNGITGDHLYIVTAADGKALEALTNRILVITPTDFKTGRRYIKGVTKIIVARAGE